MTLPEMRYQDGVSCAVQNSFGGLDMRLGAGDGAIAAMENLTGDHYPLASARPARRKIRTLTQAYGLGAADELCWVDGTSFFYNGAEKGTVSAGEKRFYTLNRYIVIWPDKKYYNTATDTFGTLEAGVTDAEAVAHALFMSSAAPNGVSDTDNGLMLYGLTIPFQVNDAVTIAGCTRHKENNRTLVIRAIEGDALYFYDGSFTLDRLLTYTAPAAGLAAGEYNVTMPDGWGGWFTVAEALTEGDTIVITDQSNAVAITRGGATTYDEVSIGFFGRGELAFVKSEKAYQEPGAVTVTRAVPEMDYLCECDNRLWGCRGDSVYCSYLGDPRIWYNFDDVATACWSVEVGSAGAFTGAFAYGGYPLLFKEDHIYRVYGTEPENFQLVDSVNLGCESGSGASFAAAGGVLYYKSPAGFVAYTGGTPRLIDEALGTARRKNAVAGGDGRKYYASCSDGNGWSLLVYDGTRGLWHREDDSRAAAFARREGELYMLRGNEIWRIGRSGSEEGEAESAVESFCQFADFGREQVYKKGVSAILLRVSADNPLTVSIQYDDQTQWQPIGSVSGTDTLRIVPRRCDRFRLKLAGTGDWKLYSLAREFTAGSRE